MKIILSTLLLIVLSACTVGYYEPGYYYREPNGHYYYYSHEGKGYYYRHPEPYEKHGERYERWEGHERQDGHER